DLEAEGLIEGTVGRGTFVSKFVLNLIRQPKLRATNYLFWDGFLAEEQRDDSLGCLMVSMHEPGAISFSAPLSSGEQALPDLVGAPVTSEGMDLDFVSAALEQSKVKLIFASPNFQNPTGRSMPLASRKRLLELAEKFQVPVVEDDIYGVLAYNGRELAPLKALDASGLVIYLNSFSKVGFSGLRVGWIAASRRVVERLTAA